MPELELTTAREAEAQAAVAEAPAEEQQQEVEQPEAEQAESASDSGAEEQEQESKEEQPKKKGGWQTRVDKLTKRNYILEAQLEEYRHREGLQARGNGQSAPQSQPVPGLRQKPTHDDPKYKSYEEFTEDLSKWAVEEHEFKRREAATQERIRDNVATYNQKVAEARGKFEDYDEVMSDPSMKIPAVAQVPIIEMENGPEVAYYLATHPEEREMLLDLNEVSEARVIMELGRISHQLRAGNEGSSPKPKPGTKAAAPIKPVSSASARSTVPMDKLSPEDYRKARESQMSKSR